ncbi:MAG: hypothetical protein KatS3mg057_1955 [Herpetosiphonaceae bacterium]|nr:MAG: hypothetical protein KatS3mg057_1955 [Herpetosiphonaceae bacterium]
MRILAVDIGTGTQDILLFDSDQPLENNFQLIAPLANANCRTENPSRHPARPYIGVDWRGDGRWTLRLGS